MASKKFNLNAGSLGADQGMQNEFSIYLDLVRFVAAFLVLVYHSDFRALITDPVPFSSHGHAAVIVFFILSGYVISYITEKRENTPVAYWSSRLSRFYLLVIPVVLITPVLDMIGEARTPHFYEWKTTHDLAWLRIISSLTYMNEIWHVSIMSFSNVAFWSLCYEMWYYVMFAVATFMRGRARVLVLVLCALIVGPKILLLAPIWILGVILHRWTFPARLSGAVSWSMFIGSICAYALFQHVGLAEAGYRLLADMIGQRWARELNFSRYFLSDYVLALIVAAHFIGIRNIAVRFGWFLLPLERPIRWVAALTFPLYIMHQPLLQFFAAMFNGDPGTPVFYLQVIACTLVTVAICGTYAERKRPLVKSWFLALLKGLGSRLQRHVPGRQVAQP
ncbi:MAG: acyltransferase family protein [Telluria sp.]